jgi:hypothetical protein
VGTTLSTDFPVTPGAVQIKFGCAGIFGEAFVTKLDPTGWLLVYSTYLRSDSDDSASANAFALVSRHALLFVFRRSCRWRPILRLAELVDY